LEAECASQERLDRYKGGTLRCCRRYAADRLRARQSDVETIPLDDTSTTTAALEQTDEDILTYPLSDEALEAAAGTKKGALSISPDPHWTIEPAWPCC
jgi:hypothetical protein